MYRLPSSNWWGKKMVLPRANMVLLYGRAMEQKDGEVGAGDRPFLFDLFSLFFLDFSAL